MLSWQVTPDQVVDFEAGFSRQGNIYAGDTQNNNGTANTQGLADDGAETNRMYRENYAITHNGTWSFGTSRFVAQYDSTRNNRLRRGWPVPSRGRSAPTVRSAPASWRTIASAANSTFRCMRCSSRC